MTSSTSGPTVLVHGAFADASGSASGSGSMSTSTVGTISAPSSASVQSRVELTNDVRDRAEGAS